MPKLADNPDKLLSLTETAALLGFTPAGLYNRRHAREDLPPSYKIGSRVKFRRSEVIAWLEAHRETPVGP